jgi:spore maturation protein CgeB
MELSEADKRIYSCDLSIVGSWYPYRQEMISPLSGYDFKIWGKGWGCAPGELKKLWQGKEAVGNEQALAFNATDININTSHLQDVEGVNQRVFDIAGCGAFQLSPWQSDLPNLFDTQKEIIPYKNKKELKDLVDYYLKHENERREIARRAQEKAYREHTYKYRLRQILSLLKIE